MDDRTTAPRARVLCVDDHEQNRQLVEATLLEDGIEVTSASSGDEALASFAASPADCVLLDVRMPGKDGFATLAELRNLPRGQDVPVVFLTALRDLDTFDRALAAGADFLGKPIHPSELSARVQTLLRLGRLDAEVRAHHEEIRRQRDALMRLHLQKERLSAFVVHDLKSPVSSMRLHADLILREKGVPADALTSARTIRSLSDRLHQLVLNLLDLAKAEEGQLTPRRVPVDLRALALAVHDALGAPAAERGITFTVTLDDGATAIGDPDVVRRILENLVDNALRHAPPGTTVSIEGGLQGGAMELRVADQGPGIPAVLRDRIFDRFVQLDEGTNASRSGRGLGLSFCRVAAELSGGSIHVDPDRPGAVFVLRLPARSSAE